MRRGIDMIKKSKSLNSFLSVFLFTALCLGGCGSMSAAEYRQEVEAAYQKLAEAEAISYESTNLLASSGSASSQRTVTQIDDTGGEWYQASYQDESLFLENLYCEGTFYQRYPDISQEWIKDQEAAPSVPELDRIDGLLFLSEQISRLTVTEEESGKTIRAELSEDGLASIKETNVQGAETAMERAAEASAKAGFSDEVAAAQEEAQEKILEEQRSRTYLSGEVSYQIDGDGALRAVVYSLTFLPAPESGTPEETEEMQMVYTFQVLSVNEEGMGDKIAQYLE